MKEQIESWDGRLFRSIHAKERTPISEKHPQMHRRTDVTAPREATYIDLINALASECEPMPDDPTADVLFEVQEVRRKLCGGAPRDLVSDTGPGEGILYDIGEGSKLAIREAWPQGGPFSACRSSYTPPASDASNRYLARLAREACDGSSWSGVLLEEFLWAVSRRPGPELREALLGLAAVTVEWVECLDRDAKDDDDGEKLGGGQ